MIPDSLYQAMQDYPEGRFAAWISHLLYSYDEPIEKMTKGNHHVAPACETLRQMRGLFEAAALEKLREKAAEKFPWAFDLGKMEAKREEAKP